MGIKDFIDRVTGVAQFKEIVNEATRNAENTRKRAEELEQRLHEVLSTVDELKRKEDHLNQELEKLEEEKNKKSPKEIATLKKEPWVEVLSTQLNKNDIRNGFFELDWNEYFIKKLIDEGYGTSVDPEEEIVDRWFKELCANIVVEGDYAGNIHTGMIDIPTILNINGIN